MGRNCPDPVWQSAGQDLFSGRQNSSPIKDEDNNAHDSHIAHYEKAIAALPEGSTLLDNLKTQMFALKVNLPQKTKPGVRVDQATARLAIKQKFQTELGKKTSRDLKAAAQDNLKEIALGADEFENANRALIPNALATEAKVVSPSTGSNLQNSTFSRCHARKPWPAILKERREQNGDTQKATRPLQSPKKRPRHHWTTSADMLPGAQVRARKIRHDSLRDILVEHIKSTGAVTTSEQAAMPLPMGQ